MTSRDAADLIHLMRKELTELTCDTREEEVCKHVSLIVAPILYEMGGSPRFFELLRVFHAVLVKEGFEGDAVVFMALIEDGEKAFKQRGS